MNQQQPYIHNRGKEIRVDFAKANDGIAQGFQALIDDKQKSYDFIVKQNEDVELIKKDLNMYNNDVITRKSNELLKDTASVIKANGKVDFAKMGEIRRRTSELATAKRNSELSVKAADEVIKLMAQNAPNMKDVTGTYAKIMSSLKDESNLLSPKDAYAEAMKQYRDGIDYVKVVQGRINEQAKMGTQFQDAYYNKRGDLIKVKGVLPPGYIFDRETGKSVPNIQTRQDGTKSNPLEDFSRSILSPEEMEGYKKQIIGAGIMFDEDPINHISGFINGSFSNLVSLEIDKTSEEIANKVADTNVKIAKGADLAYKNTPEYRKWERGLAEQKVQNGTISASAASTQASIAMQKFGLSKEQYESDLIDNGYTRNADRSLTYDRARDNRLARSKAKGDGDGEVLYSDEEKKTEESTKPKNDGKTKAGKPVKGKVFDYATGTWK